MPETIQILLNMLAQFTGGRGGIDHVIVNYVIAGFFWGGLWCLARARQRESPTPREALLLWGFGFAMSRELFMIFMAVLQALGGVDPVSLHVVFPPLEHELHDLALVFLGGAYLRFLLSDEELARRFIQVGLSVTVLCYLASFWWWADYIVAHPESKFGQTWPDWMFHINRSIWALVPASILAARADGWARNAIVTAFLFFFIDAVLKIPDMATGEVYEEIFAPISRSFYLLGIPIFGYVYIREQWIERQRAEHALHEAHAGLENQVVERTRALRDALAKEERAVADLEAFSYSAAHDLKAPLRAVRGYSEALSEDYAEDLKGEGRELLERIRSSVGKMGTLIDDLLSYSGIGRGEMVFEMVSLDDVLAQARANLGADIEESGATIRLPETTAAVEGHRLSLELMCQNLIGNAIKYVDPDRRPEVEVTLEVDAHDHVLVVRDNGIGIPPEHRERIFRVFERLHGVGEYSGTGIGLAIVMRVIELHGGAISLTSVVGEGTTFTIQLPRQRRDAENSPPETAPDAA